MAFTSRQLRAISHCAKRYERRLSLCPFPLVYFVDKETGETLKVHINEVLEVYDTDRKEDAKERARQRKAQKKALTLA